MAQRVYLPTIYDGSSDFETLFRICSYLEQLDEDIILDFSRCTFLKHNAVAVLGGIAHRVKARGFQVHFEWNTCTQLVLKNLNRNGFTSRFNEHVRISYFDTGNTIPYRHDRTKDKNAILTYLMDYWLGRGLVNLSPGLASYIGAGVWESYENAFSHAASDIGVFSCGQYFPKINVLSLCVADFGAGISSRVQSYWQHKMQTDCQPSDFSMGLSILSCPAQAMKWAFIKGTSTRPSIPGGLGLYTLKTLIVLNKGEMTVYSNDACMTITADGEQYYRHKQSFQGTVVNISLKCDADEKRYRLAGEI